MNPSAPASLAAARTRSSSASGPPSRMLSATVPVKIVEECRETIGRTVVFFKSADRIIVDGNEEVRTQSSRSGPCQTPAR